MNSSNTAGLDMHDSPLPFESDELTLLADRADWLLLRLVLCSAAATLLLALASSLGR